MPGESVSHGLPDPGGRGASPRLAYGPGPLQFGDLWLPAGEGSAGPHPTAIVIHGGYWRNRYGLDLMDGLGADLARRGIAAWNIEYRRIGDEGGAWPGTFLDVARAADHLLHLAPRYGLDLARVAALGHSAGGHLALWLAGRSRVPPGALPEEPDRDEGTACPVVGVVSLAGVTDLARCWRLNLSRGAAGELLGGGPDDVPERYAAASPAELLPLGVPQVLVHGTADDAVPPELSVDYAAKARAAGDDVTLRVLPGVDHFAVIDPNSAAWAVIVGELERLLG